MERRKVKKNVADFEGGGCVTQWEKSHLIQRGTHRVATRSARCYLRWFEGCVVLNVAGLTLCECGRGFRLHHARW